MGIESSLGADGVRDETVGQQSLVLLSQCLLTQVLLNELPIVVECLVLLCYLWVVCALLILSQELGEHVRVKATCLLVDERSLHQHGIGSLAKHVLHLGVGNRQTELLSFLADDNVVDIRLPYLVLDVVQFILGQVVATLGHLNDLLVLVNEFLEFLNVDFLS